MAAVGKVTQGVSRGGGIALYNGTLREQVEWYGSLSGRAPSNQFGNNRQGLLSAVTPLHDCSTRQNERAGQFHTFQATDESHNYCKSPIDGIYI